jgi:hypothetical protein
VHLSAAPLRLSKEAISKLRGNLRLKITSLCPCFATVALITVAVFAAAQAPQAAPQNDQSPATAGAPQQGMPPGGGQMRNFPAPTNLKVLPKDTSGREVRDIMEKWAGSLGVHCDTCHMADAKNPGPNGRPRLNFPDDSKPDKQIARIMYSMTEQMNKDYISKAMDLDKDDQGTPVTCGTCHRGHKMPEEYVIPKQAGPGGPPPSGAMPSGAMPSGAPPPPSN